MADEKRLIKWVNGKLIMDRFTQLMPDDIDSVTMGVVNEKIIQTLMREEFGYMPLAQAVKRIPELTFDEVEEERTSKKARTDEAIRAITKDVTCHDDLARLLEGAGVRQRSVKWSVRITCQFVELKKMIEAMKKCTAIRDMRGQIEKGVGKGVNPHIQAVIRFEQTQGKHFVEKVLTGCRTGLMLNVGQIYWLPVTSTTHLANLLVYVWKDVTAINGTKFSSGDYSEENIENCASKKKE